MTQAQALKLMRSGANVFLTGAPGAGKTYVLNQFIEWAEEQGKAVAITASTGIAASHIGGTTIHSFSGLGIADSITDEDLERLTYSKRIAKRYKRTDILVIDEVSMLHGYRLDMVNRVAKHLRKNGLPFGGMQVILVGDLFQLPPVTRGSSGEADFAHNSQAWAELKLCICYLTEQHRQQSNDVLLTILEAMRRNQVTPAMLNLLSKRLGARADDKTTRLYSHNVDVDAINQQRLNALQGKAKRYAMASSGNPNKIEALQRNILAPAELVLKPGAEVMFVANNFGEGFVNGSRGTVLKFVEGDPLVKLKSGRELKVGRHKWQTKEDGFTVAEVKQHPLRLAWAITIHKSQGMSLDAAIIDLAKAFQPAMGYVALSRVRSLDGLYLDGINDMALTMHGSIYDFDAQLRLASEAQNG